MTPTLKATAAAACVLTCCLGNPADAVFVNQHGVTFMESQDIPLSHRGLFNSLRAVNVYTVDGFDWDQCKVNGDTYNAGFYNTDKNFIVLCTNGPNAQVWNTFTHEAVHAVQDCRDGINTPLLVAHVKSQYFYSIGPRGLNYIMEKYPKDQWDAEIEARHFADHPALVSAGVEKFCF